MYQEENCSLISFCPLDLSPIVQRYLVSCVFAGFFPSNTFTYLYSLFRKTEMGYSYIPKFSFSF